MSIKSAMRHHSHSISECYYSAWDQGGSVKGRVRRMTARTQRRLDTAIIAEYLTDMSEESEALAHEAKMAEWDLISYMHSDQFFADTYTSEMEDEDRRVDAWIDSSDKYADVCEILGVSL